MKALILAAGRGTRMNIQTLDRPKCLLKVQGKSLLDWQIEAIRAAGINDIAVVTGYKHELISRPRLHKFHNPNWQSTNMVSSLECAHDWLKSDSCIVSYSDIFYSPEAVKMLLSLDSHLAITYHVDWLSIWTSRFGDPLIDAESLRLSESGSIVEIGRKPKSKTEVQGQYMGLLRISPNGWNEMKKLFDDLNDTDRNTLSMTEMLQKIVEGRVIDIKALPYDGLWGEIDSERDLEIFNSKKSS